MSCTLYFLLLLLLTVVRAAGLTHAPPSGAHAPGAHGAHAAAAQVGQSTEWHLRVPRGSKDQAGRSRHLLPISRTARPRDPDGFFTTPRSFNGSLRLHNPLSARTEVSRRAYALLLLALLIFSVGVVANLALMCIVWHNYYLQTTWNCLLASLACWDFVLLFLCLPVVIFNELTKRRLMGELSCRLVPYVEVTSLGVTTFTLCALSIDRFRVLTSSPRRPQQLEACGSIVAKLSVVWLGSLLLAIPELLLWQLVTETAPVTGLPLDTCVRQPSPTLPEAVYSLVLTYHEARMWWSFGCYLCLPLLFSLACQLLARHVTEDATRHGRSSSCSASSAASSFLTKKPRMQRGWEVQLSRTVLALAGIYVVGSLPEHAWNIGLAYAGVQVDADTLALLALIGQYLTFARAAATPVLVLCACRSLGRNFMDCCCCCCEECLPDRASSSSSSSSTTATAMSSSPSSPVSANEEKLQIVSGTTPAVFFDKIKDNSAEMAIGTPC